MLTKRALQFYLEPLLLRGTNPMLTFYISPVISSRSDKEDKREVMDFLPYDDCTVINMLIENKKCFIMSVFIINTTAIFCDSTQTVNVLNLHTCYFSSHCYNFCFY